jgi:hypothetical protein
VATCPGCNPSTAAFYTENTYTANETITYSGNVAHDVPIGFQTEAGGTCARGHSPCSINAKYYNNTIYNAALYNFIDGSCTNHTLDIEKNIVDGGTTDIHSTCATTWNYNMTAFETGIRSGAPETFRYMMVPGNFTPGHDNPHAGTADLVLRCLPGSEP